MNTIEQLLVDIPRIHLSELPTPLHRANRLADKLGIRRILIKRDDLTGLALGGNKARKLEFLLADAQEKGADCIVISAAAQSNMVRMTAGACSKLGMEIYPVLRSMSDNPLLQGNLLLDALFGAKVTFIQTLDPYSELSIKVMEDLMASLSAQGKNPYLIDLRYRSAPLAALGYFAAVDELDQQFKDHGILPDYIFVCAGSGTTQAGLILGLAVKNLDIKVIGISVQKPATFMERKIKEKITETAKLLNFDAEISDSQITVDDRWIGEAYGIPSLDGLEAIKMAARLEGIILDPVYSGKALAGMIGWAREGKIKPHETIIFLHSGGVPALFSSADNLDISIEKMS